MINNEFNIKLFSLIMTRTFHEYDKQTETISKNIFINEFGETAKSISEEERLQQHLISLSPLNLEKPKEQLKVVLEKYICVQACFSKLNEEAKPFSDLILAVFTHTGNTSLYLDSPEVLEEFINYFNKVNNKRKLFNSLGSIICWYDIPDCTLLFMKHEKYSNDLWYVLSNLCQIEYKWLVNPDTVRLFDKAPDKARSIFDLLLYTRNLFITMYGEETKGGPQIKSPESDEMQQKLRPIIKKLYNSIENADKIVTECTNNDNGKKWLISKEEFFAIVEKYAPENTRDLSKLGIFKVTPKVNDQPLSLVDYAM
ncbi:hypothetical protein [Legionella fairfieldensis]|uniref:hypothetical protein n=1 Tax=Legionella fairfieldensis TaxID=45064 RepID=UPI00048F4044|nr:hypothetical protein [Legionella fairfieldensis]